MRTKQIFPYHAYSKVVEAILEGQKSPSELLRLKVLSKSKLHRYLNLFTEKGFLIRERLPKRGNYILYHLHPKNFQIPLLIKGNIEMKRWKRKKKVKKHLKREYDNMMKPIRFLIMKYRDYLNEYQLLSDLAPHKPLDVIELIKQIENQVRCRECIKRISLQEYLTKGINAIPILIRKEHEVYCYICNHSETFYEG